MTGSKTSRQHLFLAAIVLIIGLIFCSPNTWASQSISPSGPIGGTDINQALISPPGFYGGLILGYIDFDKWYFDDSTGHRIDDGQTFAAFGLTYVWDATIFGGSVMSSVSGGYEDLTFGFNDDNTYYNAKGAIDVYTDLFFWSRFFPGRAFAAQPRESRIPYGLALGAGLGMTLPTGQYEVNDPYNVGSNFYTFSPSVALTWTVPSILGSAFGQATQFSGRVFYNYYTENDDAQFQNGAVLSLDFAVTQIAGPVQFGISGTTYTQVTDDDLTGPRSFGRSPNKAKSFGIGPIVQYTFMAQGRPWIAKLKTGVVPYARNAGATHMAVFTLGTQF